MQIGLLGSLNYEEAQHGWAAEVGELLATLLITGLAKLLDIDLEPPLRPAKRCLVLTTVKLESNRVAVLEPLTQDLSPSAISDKVEYWISNTRENCMPFLLIGFAKQCYEVESREQDEDLKNHLESMASAKLSLLRDRYRIQLDLGNLTRALRRPDNLQQRTKALLKEWQQKLVILILVPDPEDQKHINLLQELATFNEVILKAEHRQLFQVEHAFKCRASELSRLLMHYKPNFLHFCGHGQKDGLCFESDNGGTMLLGDDTVANMLKGAEQRGLRAVLMNACYSISQAQGVANVVGSAMGMQGLVFSPGAVSFTKRFYEAIGEGLELEDAFNEAKNSPSRDLSVKVHLAKKRLDDGQEMADSLQTPYMPWISMDLVPSLSEPEVMPPPGASRSAPPPEAARFNVPAEPYTDMRSATEAPLPAYSPSPSSQRAIAHPPSPFPRQEHSVTALYSTSVSEPHTLESFANYLNASQGLSKNEQLLAQIAASAPPDLPSIEPKLIPIIGYPYLKLDKRFRGLHVVAGELESTEIDIIFVHGLGSIPEYEWKAQGAVMSWISDPKMLPRKIPQARVLTFSYPSQWIGLQVESLSLPSAGAMLHQELATHIYRCGRSRKYILIGHSYGGLVIEKAFVLGDNLLRRFCLGIILLGTPNKGSQVIKDVIFFAKTHLLDDSEVKGEKMGFDTKALECFETPSGVFVEVTKQFEVQCLKQGTPLVCFYETNKTAFPGILGEWFKKSALSAGKDVRRSRFAAYDIDSEGRLKIVTEGSVTFPNWPSFPLATDHYGLNSFSDPNDANYVLVSDALARMASRSRGS